MEQLEDETLLRKVERMFRNDEYKDVVKVKWRKEGGAYEKAAVQYPLEFKCS